MHDQILRLIYTVALAFVIAVPFSFLARAQETTDEQAVEVRVPDAIMKQVVNRVLRWYFKPRLLRTTVDLYGDDVKESWLPKIRNVRFRLLSIDEFQKFKGVAYLFTEPVFDSGFFQVGFAMGDGCAYTGDNWSFRLVKGKLRLRISGGVDGLCYS